MERDGGNGGSPRVPSKHPIKELISFKHLPNPRMKLPTMGKSS